MLIIANPGSSSRKYALFNDEGKIACSASFTFDGKAGNSHVFELPDKTQYKFLNELDSLSEAFGIFMDFIQAKLDVSIDNIVGVGLRNVAPLSYFAAHHIVDDEFVDRLTKIKKLNTQHIPTILNELEVIRKSFPDLPIVVCSDSAFHQTVPDTAKYYAFCKREIADKMDFLRFGAHGLSVESIVDYLKNHEQLPENLIVCHLGSGMSVTAVHEGRSVYNSMGFNPNEGIVMSTRCGSDFNSSVFTHIESMKRQDDEIFINYLNFQCGLKGLCGYFDLRDVISGLENGDEDCTFAFAKCVLSIRKEIREAIEMLGGNIDCLIFTATAGERNTLLRESIINGFETFDSFGIKLSDNQKQTIGPCFSTSLVNHGLFIDHGKNMSVDLSKRSNVISGNGFRPIKVITTGENDMIAKHTTELL